MSAQARVLRISALEGEGAGRPILCIMIDSRFAHVRDESSGGVLTRDALQLPWRGPGLRVVKGFPAARQRWCRSAVKDRPHLAIGTAARFHLGRLGLRVGPD